MNASTMNSLEEVSARLAQPRDRGIPPALFGIARRRCALDTGVNLLAGPPSIGLSALAFQIAGDAVAQFPDTHVAIFPVKDGVGSAAEHLIRQRKSRKIADDNQRIQIDLGVALRAKELIRRINRWAKQHPHGRRLVVIDSLDALHGIELHRNSGHRVVAKLSALAHALPATILLCASLKPRPRCDTEQPTLSELEQYGPIIEDCDRILLLYRDAYFHGDSRDPDEAELHTWGWRDGHYFIQLGWDRDNFAFSPFPPTLVS